MDGLSVSFEEHAGPFDAALIWDGFESTARFECREGNVFLLTAEPSSIRNYYYKYTKQFDFVLSTIPGLSHPRLLAPLAPYQPSLLHCGEHRIAVNDSPNWRPAVNPEFFLTFINSPKDLNSFHNFRKSLEGLLGKYGCQLFGNHLTPIPTKAHVLYNSLTTVAVENTNDQGYNSEKLIDALLGGAIPLYFGPQLKVEPWLNKYIIRFDSVEELTSILNGLEEKKETLVELRNQLITLQPLIIKSFNFTSAITSEVLPRVNLKSKIKYYTLSPESNIY